jgi:rhodanese-related sulfurtransferase
MRSTCKKDDFFSDSGVTMRNFEFLRIWRSRRDALLALALAFAFALAPAAVRAQAPAATQAPPAAAQAPQATAAPAPVDWAERDRKFQAQLAQINAFTKARQVSVDELQAKLKKGEKIVLLDVREPEENQESALAGARLAVPKQVRTMPLDDIPADATVVTYCTAGYRSGLAAVILEGRLGRPVYTLNGGIIEWYNRGGQVVDPAGKPVNRVNAVEEPWISYVHPR